MKNTVTVSISGAVCGALWWPSGCLAGKSIHKTARGPWGFWQDGDSFRDALLSLLMKEGGDFQSAGFTEDTALILEMRLPAPQGYRVRIKETPLVRLKDCADLIRKETFAADFAA